MPSKCCSRTQEASWSTEGSASSGLKVSAVGLGSGSATFVGKADEETSVDIIRHAFDSGINYFDTAETYAEGRAETLLGAALSGKRSEVIIATKFGKDRSVSGGERPGSRSRLMKAVEGSLRRLNTDYIDLYILHQPDPETPIAETLRALTDLVRAGKVRYIGCSDLAAWQLSDAVWTSKEQHLESFITAGFRYNMIARDVERELVPCAQAHGVGIVPTMPFASGFLTGKYRRGEAPPENARFTSPPPFAGSSFQNLRRYDKILTDANYEALQKLEAFAVARDHTIAELAIAWLLAQPWVGAIPLGVSSKAQLTQNLASIGWSLSPQDLLEIDGLV